MKAVLILAMVLFALAAILAARHGDHAAYAVASFGAVLSYVLQARLYPRDVAFMERAPWL